MMISHPLLTRMHGSLLDTDNEEEPNLEMTSRESMEMSKSEEHGTAMPEDATPQQHHYSLRDQAREVHPPEKL